MTNENTFLDNMISVIIDGREVTVPARSTVLDAARKLGIPIPTFCYYAKLISVGACRMCLVEVEKMRGLQTACTTEVRPGMVVRTDTPEIRKARAANLEFLLTNHPLDCPVCDKGGECELQDQTFIYGPGKSRFIEEKRRKAKARVLGPYIIMDQERCVLCRRCIRFLEEWADDVQLGLFERGRLTYVDTFNGEPFDTPFSGNTVHLCPVGALTSRVFRFSARSWELKHTPSVCLDCAVGCNISLHTKYNRLKRIVSREHPDVNDEWLCDRGQFDHRPADASLRVLQPLVREDGELKPASWEEALERAAKALREAAQARGTAGAALLGSPIFSNEANYLLQRLARGALGTNNLDMAAEVPARPRLLPTTRKLEQSDLVLIAGMDLLDVAPMLELFARHAGVMGCTRFIMVGTERSRLARYGRWLECRPGTETAVINGLVHAILRSGKARPAPGMERLQAWMEPYTPAAVAHASGAPEAELRAAAGELAAAQRLTILYGGARAGDATLRGALDNLALVCGAEGPALVPAQANAIGALDMGVSPAFLPGYQPYSDQKVLDRYHQIWGRRVPAEPGPGRRAWFGQTLPAAIVLGAVPAGLRADSLVVITSWKEDFPADADVVLPACTFAECDGTYTNLTGRVQWARAALRPTGESRPAWWILAQLGLRLGEADKWRFSSAEEVFAEIARCVPGYEGLSYAVLGEAGAVRDIAPDKLAVQEVHVSLAG